LAKLHHGVTLFLEEAIGIFHEVVTQYKDISPQLLVCKASLSLLCSLYLISWCKFWPRVCLKAI